MKKILDPIVKEAMAMTTASLIKIRVKELKIDINSLPEDAYIDDAILRWLMDKYKIMNENIKAEEK